MKRLSIFLLIPVLLCACSPNPTGTAPTARDVEADAPYADAEGEKIYE